MKFWKGIKMKKLLFGLILLGSFLAHSTEVYKVVVCDNLSEDFFEDTLVINFYTKEATYNPNDVDVTIPCSTLLNGVTQCSNGHWTIHVPEGGENTIVFEGKDLERKIPFDCKY